MGRKKKQYVEDHIFRIYPDFPVLIIDSMECEQNEKPLHFHYYLEISYCFEGEGILSSNNQNLHIQKGDITITAPNLLHNMQGSEHSAVRSGYLYVDLEDLIKLFPYGEERSQIRMSQEIYRDILMIASENYPDVEMVLKEIFRLDKEKTGNYKLQIIGLLFTLIMKIYDIFSYEERQGRNEGNLPIMPAIDYIYDHYMEQIKVGELAAVCHFSESYFRKVFLEMKGMGPMDYLNSIRIREACRMLLNSTDTVRVVGEKCGFTSITTFERNFRQRVGMLPSQWRENHVNRRKKHRDEYQIKRVYIE